MLLHEMFALLCWATNNVCIRLIFQEISCFIRSLSYLLRAAIIKRFLFGEIMLMQTEENDINMIFIHLYMVKTSGIYYKFCYYSIPLVAVAIVISLTTRGCCLATAFHASYAKDHLH